MQRLTRNDVIALRCVFVFAALSVAGVFVNVIIFQMIQNFAFLLMFILLFLRKKGPKRQSIKQFLALVS